MECLVDCFIFILFCILIKILLSLGICFFWYTFLAGMYFQRVLSNVVLVSEKKASQDTSLSSFFMEHQSILSVRNSNF